MKYQRGSNQHRVKLRKNYWASLWFILLCTTWGIYVVQPRIVSPCPETGCASSFIKTVYAKEPRTELQEIVDYIVYKFEPEGKAVVVQAINCFYSESGLRNDAFGVNRNGTNDVGVAQINSIHGMSTEDRMDYRKNVDKAYQIYKSRGWDAWYGAHCN